MKVFLIVLFIIGALFIIASHLPVWLVGGDKPKHANWKLYAVIGIAIWFLILILANQLL